MDTKRQKSLFQKRVDAIVSGEETITDELEKKWFNRNRMLIDLECTPDDIQQEIMSQYNTPIDANQRRRDLLSFFMEKRMRTAVDDLSDY